MRTSNAGKPSNLFLCVGKKCMDAPGCLAAKPLILMELIERPRQMCWRVGKRAEEEGNIFTRSQETSKRQWSKSKEERGKKCGMKLMKKGEWAQRLWGENPAEATDSKQKICSHVEAESTGGLTEEGREMGFGCFLLSILISIRTLTHTQLRLTHSDTSEMKPQGGKHACMFARTLGELQKGDRHLFSVAPMQVVHLKHEKMLDRHLPHNTNSCTRRKRYRILMMPTVCWQCLRVLFPFHTHTYTLNMQIQTS